METRTLTQVKIWKLILNPMLGNTENSAIVAISDDKQKLIDWYNSQLAAEPYKDEGAPSFEVHGDSHVWHKVFTKGSELEWFNPCNGFEEPSYFGHGLRYEWVSEEAINNTGYKFIY